MNNEMARIGTEGLAFFSKTNRLISHELKNVLAIISETMGLIEELSAMAAEGADLPPGKVKSLSESILEEIGRANRIIRGMNDFAHQVDQFLEEIDLTQSVPLIIDLAGLDANVKKITFQLGAADPCQAYTSPFFLNALIFRLIRGYAGQASPDSIIRVDFTADETSAGIVFAGLQPELLADFPTTEQQFLADLLQARLTLAEKDSKLKISIPKLLDKSILEVFL
ncbi:MAG: hypothetical protein ACLFPD_09290 [Desulfosudaceae bacterium]